MRRLLFHLRLMLMTPIGVPAGLWYRLVARRLPGHGHWLRLHVPRLIGRLFLALYGIRPRLSGAGHLDIGRERGVVVFSNHVSRLDPYVLFAVLPFAYKSFWSTKAHVMSESIGFARRYGEVFDLFFLHDKKDPRATAREFRRAAEHVRGGQALSFFPEGRLAASDAPSEFGIACAKLALAAGAPILPLAIAGTEAYYERRGELPAGPVRVRVGPAVATEGLGPRDARALSRRVEALVRALQAELEAEGPDGSADPARGPRQP